MQQVEVSIIVTTKNEEKNIANCLQSVKDQTYPKEKIEIIVVDINSKDNTVGIAKKFTDMIYNKEPNRATQLNYGVEKAKGKYILYIDADMILSKKVIEECVTIIEENNSIVALYIPEKIIGKGFWIKVRDFERNFYNGTCIDAVRFIKRDTYLEAGGFDEKLDFGPDDWDFHRRIISEKTGSLNIIKTPLKHNEGEFNLKRYLSKKGNYVKTFDKYIKKWGKNDHIIKKQFSPWYRVVGIFIENGKWKRLVKHPVLTIGIFFLRFMVGVQYIRKICK